MLITAENEAAWAKSRVNALMMLRKLHERGIRIVPGSDSIAGFTLHRELELYAEAGIPNADVLRLATLESADIAGVAGRSGSVSVGKDADLVLLDGNPLEDMSAIRRAVTVVKGEWLYRPAELYPAVGVTKFVDSLPAEQEGSATAGGAY
jgi:imidazolonepropionase-like amidohydrolase